VLVALKKQSAFGKLIGKDIVKKTVGHLTEFKVMQTLKNCGQLLDRLLVAQHLSSLELMLIHLIVIMQMFLPTLIIQLPV